MPRSKFFCSIAKVIQQMSPTKSFSNWGVSRCGRRCWRLCLHSGNNCTKEDDPGDRRCSHIDNITQGTGVSPLVRALRNVDAAPQGTIAAVSLHILHVVLNLIVAFGLSPAAPATLHTHGVPPPLVQRRVRYGKVAAVGEVLCR